MKTKQLFWSFLRKTNGIQSHFWNEKLGYLNLGEGVNRMKS